MGMEKGTSPRMERQPYLPKIDSRPGTMSSEVNVPIIGRFVAKTDATCFEVDVTEFNACMEFYALADKEREGNVGYVASFLAALEIFSTWPWLEVLEPLSLH